VFSTFPEFYGGDDETRTRDLCRDRRAVNLWRAQNQQVRRAVVGNRWAYRAPLGHFMQRFVQRRRRKSEGARISPRPLFLFWQSFKHHDGSPVVSLNHTFDFMFWSIQITLGRKQTLSQYDTSVRQVNIKGNDSAFHLFSFSYCAAFYPIVRDFSISVDRVDSRSLRG
jgi:hypothetical protein